jgi:glycosyltransferase involved in cell wall biosynthesis
MLVSVIIPARDASATLGEQLDALARQDYGGEWEVVIADNGSRDGTKELATRYADRFGRLTVVDASRAAGSASARNDGVREARGEVLAFCDADDVVDSHWLSALVDATEKHPLVAGMVRLHIGSEREPIEEDRDAQLDFLPFADTCSMAVQRGVYDKVGGFDESFIRCSDKVFSWRAHLAGYEMTVVEDAIVNKRQRGNRPRRMAQLYRWAAGEPRLFANFAEHGMPRSGTGRALADHALIVIALPFLWLPPIRAWWRSRAPLRAGRLVGSLAVRRRYL